MSSDERMYFPLPTTNDGIQDFEPLFALQEELQARSQIGIDFSSCHFLRQNAVAFLGGLARYAECLGGSVTFDWSTVRRDVRNNLVRNGFLAAFGGETTYFRGNTIPYHEDQTNDKRRITTYLREQWLGSGRVMMSVALRDEIVSKVVEIYDNAFTHAKSPVGIISCGQYYPNLRLLKLTAVDFGVGIPANVRRFKKKKNMPATEAIEWALQRGNTTVQHNHLSRGLGLDLLKQFVATNGGTLEIFSGNGYACVDELGIHLKEIRKSFTGSLITITLRCDESYYVLQSELQSQDAGALFF